MLDEERLGSKADSSASTTDKPGLGTAAEATAQNVDTIADLQRAAKADTTAGEKVALRIAAQCGNVAWFGSWIFLNTSSLIAHHPDPLPFPFLSFVVSLEAIFLSTIIL